MKTFSLFAISVLLSTQSCGYDFSSPEKTLERYLACFEVSDKNCILSHYHGIKGFYVGPKRKVNFIIKKKILYGDAETNHWNNTGIIPSAKVGDIQLDVLQTTNGEEGMYSYNLRNYSGEWKIYAHSAWGVD